MFSQTLRAILREQYEVTLGRYSYGICDAPGRIPHGTTIGNFTSIAEGVVILRRNHPIDRLSQHAFFFNRGCGLLLSDAVAGRGANPLRIGHDVWIGANVIVLPRCKSIGNGAIVGAGSVVTRNVEPFTIVAGNPAKVLRPRFPRTVKDQISASEWWLQPLAELAPLLPCFLEQITESDCVRQMQRLANLTRKSAAPR